MYVGRGTQPVQALISTAKDVGLPYYKLTFLSLATASQQELRRRAVMAARRKTWLVLLDCEILTDSLSSVNAALKLLPHTLATPTVICVLAKGFCEVTSLSSAVIVNLDSPTSLSSNIESYLHLGYECLHTNADGNSTASTSAAVLATAYVFAVLHARKAYGDSSWISCPWLPRVVFEEGLLASQYYTHGHGKISWETLSAILSKVVFGSVLTSNMDQLVLDKICNDHLNDKTFSVSQKPMKVHRQAVVAGSPTPDETRDEMSPTTDIARITADAVTDLLGPIVPQMSPSERQGSILLHSFPKSKLYLNLQSPSEQAIEKVCEKARGSEAQLLGLSEHNRHLQHHRELTRSLEVFTRVPWVCVPRWVVLQMLRELDAFLPGPLTSQASEVLREEDLETLAWQQETEIWDKTQKKCRHLLNQIREAVTSGSAHPAQALLATAYLVCDSFLDSEACNSSKYFHNYEMKLAAQENLTSLWMARSISEDVQALIHEWKARHAHLLSWVKSETAPVVVRLGVMKLPGWWLTRLRQSVCIKAHWPLQGSLVYAVPAKRNIVERPNNGVCISGASVVGGKWYNEKIYPDAPQYSNSPIMLTLTVSHSTPPAPVTLPRLPNLLSCVRTEFTWPGSDVDTSQPILSYQKRLDSSVIDACPGCNMLPDTVKHIMEDNHLKWQRFQYRSTHRSCKSEEDAKQLTRGAENEDKLSQSTNALHGA
ncbi:hypothetical protein SK128_021179 [Halocaridina rubra]|uniref:Dynein heavy chain C-terminal domain-containing protein n=1 Tax=Halocaridina rubra TaxID=373956 RepID=A0AAN9A1L0_HALRR